MISAATRSNQSSEQDDSTVSGTQGEQHFVANLSNQPVELHLPSGHQMLPPRGRATLAASDLQAPQLLALRKSRVVMTGLVPAPAAADPGAESSGSEQRDSEKAVAPKSRAGKPKEEQ